MNLTIVSQFLRIMKTCYLYKPWLFIEELSHVNGSKKNFLIHTYLADPKKTSMAPTSQV